ncbi:hypothetical protein TRIATDRAFT_86118 [Trichoderma atroviride IMI 206040]|uniref:Uncharacterized protein n=1 Tax=Hypocrea atroviridis (strain ATCC 20476 / IMI 206040) TaxID=452589 RepID=G9P3T2_HYPAI|nr:uncharacterized protein TRIATDRAFT_86118 [Trichoderma atroviride IMI 206040]EHK43038.1 hypothetical protein TRIATDRAFT_86118 [Trichoderma atroviride IMI 206040]
MSNAVGLVLSLLLVSFMQPIAMQPGLAAHSFEEHCKLIKINWWRRPWVLPAQRRHVPVVLPGSWALVGNWLSEVVHDLETYKQTTKSLARSTHTLMAWYGAEAFLDALYEGAVAKLQTTQKTGVGSEKAGWRNNGLYEAEIECARRERREDGNRSLGPSGTLRLDQASAEHTRYRVHDCSDVRVTANAYQQLCRYSQSSWHHATFQQC